MKNMAMVCDLSDEDLRNLFNINPEWVADKRPWWTAINMSNWMIHNRTEWMADNVPYFMITAEPEWMGKYRPKVMRIHRLGWMLEHEPAYMAAHPVVWCPKCIVGEVVPDEIQSLLTPKGES